jgi:hypothetical protein
MLAAPLAMRHTCGVTSATRAGIRIDWPAQRNVHGGSALWFAAWLVGDAGEEAGALYNGRGGESTTGDVPPDATGIRFYRWINEGLDPEYCDIDLPASVFDPANLDFDRAQRFSRLRLHPDD